MRCELVTKLYIIVLVPFTRSVPPAKEKEAQFNADEADVCAYLYACLSMRVSVQMCKRAQVLVCACVLAYSMCMCICSMCFNPVYTTCCKDADAPEEAARSSSGGGPAAHDSGVEFWKRVRGQD
eukprot:scaffold239045_cov22-Tisochrysis_lutea.AAC.1